MMNRMHRAGKAPFKIILALPLIALLALAMARPRLILAKGPLADDKQEVAQKQDKPAMSEQDLKDLQVKLEEKAKVLEEKLNSTTDPEEKQKLKQALDNIYKKRQVVMTELGLAPKEKAKGVKYIDEEKLKELLAKFAEKEKDLKDLYSSADTPEKKEKIKQDLDMLFKKRQVILSDYRVAKVEKPSREELEKKLQKVKEIRLKLKQAIAEEKDEVKAKELKMKFAELGEIEEKLKTKLDESSPKRP